MKNSISEFIQNNDLIYALQKCINDSGHVVYSNGEIQMQNAVTIKVTLTHNTVLHNEDIEGLIKHICKAANEFRTLRRLG